MQQELNVNQMHKSQPRYSGQMMTRVKVESTGVGDGLELNERYFLTLPGIIKIVQIIIAIIVLCCISPPLNWYSRLFTSLVAISFAVTVLLCFSYLVSLSNVVLPKFNWLFTEFVYTVAVAVLYLVTSIFQLAFTSRYTYKAPLKLYGYYAGYIVAGVFGLLNFLVYSGGGYYLAMEWKNKKQSNTISPNNNIA